MVLAVNIAVYSALVLAVWQAGRGSFTAITLVVTNLIARVVAEAGWPMPYEQMVIFDIMTIGVIVVGAIHRRYMLTREIIICALFLLAWRFYYVPEIGWESASLVQFYVLSGIVYCQLMLTLPWRTIYYKMRKRLGFPYMKPPHRLERVAHA